MKKYIYIIAFLGLGLSVYGQSGRVGINIEKPEATLDIKQKDASTTKILTLHDNQGAELVTVQADGKTGIGTPNPAATLDVNGYVKLGSADSAGDAKPQPGMIRFNTITKKFQGYTQSSGWVDLH